MWCNAREESCAYNYPKDDLKTKAASLSAVIIAQFCNK